jgi:tyrosine-protein phosphatase YwqE
MFKFFQKSPDISDYSFLGVDLHSHLLPGIDDGAKDIEQSLALIRRMKEMGFRQLITTPHVMADLYPNTPEIIQEKLEVVRTALKADKLEMPIYAAAEYLMDEAFEEKIASEQLLCLPGRRVLVEMSFISPPPKLETYIFQLQTKSYRPILAHPERYLFYRDDFKKYRELKDRGCAFQLNLLSLIGYYGRPTRDSALRLLKEGMIDYLATDMHHEKHAELIAGALKDKNVGRLLEKHREQFKNRELI